MAYAQRRLLPGSHVPAMCEDGTIRTSMVTAHADTFFSLPAQVRIRHAGKQYTVTGFLSLRDEDDSTARYDFTANGYGRNAHLLKPAAHAPLDTKALSC